MKLVKQLQGKAPKQRRTVRLPRQTLPVNLERRFAKEVAGIIAAYYAAYDTAIKALDGEMPGDKTPLDDRADALLYARAYVTDAGDLPPGFRAKLDAAARKLGKTLDTKRYRRFLERHAEATDKWNAREFSKQANAAVGVDIITTNPKLEKQVKAFTKENVDLITKVGRDTKRRVEKIVFESIEKGRNYQELRSHLQADMDIGRRRATLIARDQTGKLYGQINAERQTELGITRFTWRTSNDNRVRDEHAELEGEVFEYANPPSEGIPGEAIQCRCYAEPVFDMLADL